MPQASDEKIYEGISAVEQDYKESRDSIWNPNRTSEISESEMFKYLFSAAAYHELKEKFPEEYILGKLKKSIDK